MGQTEQLNLKLHKGLYDEIELVAKILHIPKNEWARNVLAHKVKKELEEHKTFIALEYAKGKISKKNLINILGKKDAEDVENIIKTNKKGVEKAKQLAKLIR
jgi:hypothetical protein